MFCTSIHPPIRESPTTDKPPLDSPCLTRTVSFSYSELVEGGKKNTDVCDRTHRQEVDGCVVAPLIPATPPSEQRGVLFKSGCFKLYSRLQRSRLVSQLKQSKTVYVVKALLKKFFIWKKVCFTILSICTKNVYQKNVKALFSRLSQVCIFLIWGISEVLLLGII